MTKSDDDANVCRVTVPRATCCPRPLRTRRYRLPMPMPQCDMLLPQNNQPAKNKGAVGRRLLWEARGGGWGGGTLDEL